MNECKRMAFITCSGGGVIDAMHRVQQRGVWPFEIAGIITDRPCGAEHVADRHDLPCERLNLNNPFFDHFAAETLRAWRADCVVLLHLRKIGPEIWRDSTASVWNLHPSLLPQYPGLGALERNFRDALRAARDGRELRMGVTIHLANDHLDAGPIINQRWFNIADAPTLHHASHWCYIYKVALILEALCKLIDGTLPPLHEPIGSTRWLDDYQLWQPYEPMTDVMISIAEPWAAELLKEKTGWLLS